MTPSVIPPPPRPTLPTTDGGAFPVRRIYCIGRNYAAHAVEMGHDPEKEPPFFFQKNPENADASGEFPYPSMSQDVHHEVELVVALQGGGRDLTAAQALDHVWGYGIGIDMTRRDRQAEMKAAGRPWEIGKAFERSAPMGPLHPISVTGPLTSGRITLSVNEMPQQDGDLAMMIWKVPQMIAHLSHYYDIGAGDLIMTGTPAGVGPVRRGDVMTAGIEGLGVIEVRVV